jgi:hypothetical protein
MQKNEPGKSNQIFPDLRVKGANSMSRKYRNSFIARWLLGIERPGIHDDLATDGEAALLLDHQRFWFAVPGDLCTC